MASVEDAVEQRLAQILDGLLRVGVVTGTAAGGKVALTIQGAPFTLPRLMSYTPVVGHAVLVLCAKPGAWVVLGTPATS